MPHIPQIFPPLPSLRPARRISKVAKPARPPTHPPTSHPPPRFPLACFLRRRPPPPPPLTKRKNTDDAGVVPQTAVFINIFNALGVLPAVMASMLVGGGSFRKGRQPVPAQPFVFGAFALGFFSVGPYLAVRNYLPEREEGEEMSKVEVGVVGRCNLCSLRVHCACVCASSRFWNPEKARKLCFVSLYGLLLFLRSSA